jgi:hypothetical protein
MLKQLLVNRSKAYAWATPQLVAGRNAIEPPTQGGGPDGYEAILKRNEFVDKL